MAWKPKSLEAFGLLRAMLGLGCMELPESCLEGVGEGEVVVVIIAVVVPPPVAMLREDVKDCLGGVFSFTSRERERERREYAGLRNGHYSRIPIVMKDTVL